MSGENEAYQRGYRDGYRDAQKDAKEKKSSPENNVWIGPQYMPYPPYQIWSHSMSPKSKDR